MLIDQLKDSTYLGDAVYATFDGYQIWLHTSNGIEVTNSIALEPAVYDALVRYVHKAYSKQL